MSRRTNLIVLLLVLILDVIVGVLWYILLFPPEPMWAIATVGLTLLATLFTAVTVFLNWTTYQGCISDD